MCIQVFSPVQKKKSRLATRTSGKVEKRTALDLRSRCITSIIRPAFSLCCYSDCLACSGAIVPSPHLPGTNMVYWTVGPQKERGFWNQERDSILNCKKLWWIKIGQLVWHSKHLTLELPRYGYNHFLNSDFFYSCNSA